VRTLPPRMVQALAPFAPLFSKHVFRHVQVLVAGTILAPGKRTVASLIRAHALLHQVTRERDAFGRIVATIEDYTAVRELVADLVAEGLEATVPRARAGPLGGLVESEKRQGPGLPQGPRSEPAQTLSFGSG
jgi:hypothetical protein